MTLLLVALGGALGAATRYVLDATLPARRPGRLARGILAANVVGSFVLGAVLGAAPGAAWVALLGTGFCGALTTYSTFALDTARLTREGHRGAAALNAIASLALGLGASALGYALLS